MTPGVPLDGTVLTQEVLHDSEVAQCIKGTTTMEETDFVFLIPRHPLMRPDAGFVNLVSSFQFSHPADPLSSLFSSKS